MFLDKVHLVVVVVVGGDELLTFMSFSYQISQKIPSTTVHCCRGIDFLVYNIYYNGFRPEDITAGIRRCR